jgi:hypothetical protein
MNIFLLEGYNGSRDYARLAELAQTRSVICLVDYQGCRDVAHTVYSKFDELETWTVGARGIGYISTFDREGFIASCQARNLEFIEPQGNEVTPS